MISVYINETGYYIKGPKIEAAKSCERAEGYFSSVEHLYIIVLSALRLLKDSNEKVINIYNSSRLIDELNNNASPESNLCRALHSEICQYDNLFFIKMADDLLSRKISGGQNRMIKEDYGKVLYAKNKLKKAKNKINNLKKRWFNE